MQKLKTTILILLCCSFGCINEDNYIKDVYVNIEIAINQPQYSDLNAIGNSIFITGGVKGIIIYHKSLQNYVAFDRNCSFEPSSSCSIIDSISSLNDPEMSITKTISTPRVSKPSSTSPSQSLSR